jgi:hypothetical protein
MSKIQELPRWFIILQFFYTDWSLVLNSLPFLYRYESLMRGKV